MLAEELLWSPARQMPVMAATSPRQPDIKDSWGERPQHTSGR